MKHFDTNRQNLSSTIVESTHGSTTVGILLPGDGDRRWSLLVLWHLRTLGQTRTRPSGLRSPRRACPNIILTSRERERERERERLVLVGTHDIPRSRATPHADGLQTLGGSPGSTNGSTRLLTRLSTVLNGGSARAPLTPDTGYDTTHWFESDDSEYQGRHLIRSPDLQPKAELEGSWRTPSGQGGWCVSYLS